MARWSVIGLFKADANGCEAEINSLDSITPENVLNYARENVDSELHKCFEWDDGIAAEMYRLTQARQVITHIVFERKTPEAPKVRKYEITSVRNHYEPIRVVMSKPTERESLLKRAIRDFQAFKQRYSNLTEFEEIFEKFDEMLAE